MSSINDFIASFQTAARPNRYKVTISYPSFVGADGDSLQFYAKAANIPPSTLGVIELPFRGRMAKLPGDRTFPEWTITVMNSEAFDHRLAMERWSNAINAHEGNIKETNTYLARATVTQLSQDDEELHTYIFENLWPSEVGQIELAFDQNDSVSEFTCTFQYSHWTNSETTS